MKQSPGEKFFGIKIKPETYLSCLTNDQRLLLKKSVLIILEDQRYSVQIKLFNKIH